MALPTIDDNALAEALFEIFRCQGYEGATIAQLSEATGLKKSSLYHRFPNGKDDMAKVVINYVSKQLHAYIVKPLLDSQVLPETRFDEMLKTVKGFYADGRKNCLLNALSLGNPKDEINELLNSDYDAWRNALIKLGMDAGMTQTEAESWSGQYLIAVQGALVIQRLTGNGAVFENCLAHEKAVFKKICNY